MTIEMLPFPAESIRCRRGDYVLQRGADGRTKVVRVQDLVALRRLVPFGEDSLVEEQAILDSERPAFKDEIHLLHTAFDRDFASLADAIRAIETDDLGSAAEARCLDIRHFPTSTNQVHRPPAPESH